MDTVQQSGWMGGWMHYQVISGHFSSGVMDESVVHVCGGHRVLTGVCERTAGAHSCTLRYAGAHSAADW